MAGSRSPSSNRCGRPWPRAARACCTPPPARARRTPCGSALWSVFRLWRPWILRKQLLKKKQTSPRRSRCCGLRPCARWRPIRCAPCKSPCPTWPRTGAAACAPETPPAASAPRKTGACPRCWSPRLKACRCCWPAPTRASAWPACSWWWWTNGTSWWATSAACKCNWRWRACRAGTRACRCGACRPRWATCLKHWPRWCLPCRRVHRAAPNPCWCRAASTKRCRCRCCCPNAWSVLPGPGTWACRCCRRWCSPSRPTRRRWCCSTLRMPKMARRHRPTAQGAVRRQYRKYWQGLQRREVGRWQVATGMRGVVQHFSSPTPARRPSAGTRRCWRRGPTGRAPLPCTTARSAARCAAGWRRG